MPNGLKFQMFVLNELADDHRARIRSFEAHDRRTVTAVKGGKA